VYPCLIEWVCGWLTIWYSRLVYFHPARSAGSMHEATIFALAAFLYSTIISVGSMGVSLLFYQLELIELGHAIVLTVFCAGGLGLIGYTKIAMSSPTVSVACSLASISIITILTKEGNLVEYPLARMARLLTICRERPTWRLHHGKDIPGVHHCNNVDRYIKLSSFYFVAHVCGRKT